MMPPGLDVGLAEHRRVAERALGLAAGGLHRAGQVGEGAHDPHATPTAARRCLDQHGQVAVGHGGRVQLRQDGHARGSHQLLRLDLGAHRGDRRGGRADPDQARVEHGLGELRVLREEAVAGVDGVGPRRAGGVDQQVGPQVGVGRRRAGQPDGAVGLGPVRAVGVRVGVDGDRADAEVAAGAEDPPGDLAAVGHQDSCDHVSAHIRKTPKPGVSAPGSHALDLAVRDRRQAQAQHRAGVPRVDDAVVVDAAGEEGGQ